MAEAKDVAVDRLFAEAEATIGVVPSGPQSALAWKISGSRPATKSQGRPASFGNEDFLRLRTPTSSGA